MLGDSFMQLEIELRLLNGDHFVYHCSHQSICKQKNMGELRTFLCVWQISIRGRITRLMGRVRIADRTGVHINNRKQLNTHTLTFINME